MTKVTSNRLGREVRTSRRVGDTLMSNTVYVNKNYPANDLTKMIFISLLSAYTWILKHGAVSSKNKWRILCAPGEDVSIVTNPNIYVWYGLGEQSIPLDRCVWINTDNTQDKPEERIFTNPESAAAWIIANGSPTTANPWNMFLSAGNVGDVLVRKNIKVTCNDGTIIDNLSFDTDYSMSDMMDTYITTAIVNNLIASPGKCGMMYNCIIKNVVSGDGDGSCTLIVRDSTFLSGDFEKLTIIDSSNISFINLLGDITDLSYVGDNIKLVPAVPGNELTVHDVEHIGGAFDPTECTGDNVLEGVYSSELNITEGKNIFNNCFINVLTATGGQIQTRGCVILSSTITPPATISNTGDFYDNAQTSISNSNMQAAIDEVANAVFNKEYESPTSEVYAGTYVGSASEDNVVDGETFTINSGEASEEVYVFVDAITTSGPANQVEIGTDIYHSLQNLATEIAAVSALINAVYNETAFVIYLTAMYPGSVGNAITIATDSASLYLGAATLNGGGMSILVTKQLRYIEVELTDDLYINLDSVSDRVFEVIMYLKQDDIGAHNVTIYSDPAIKFEGGVTYSATQAAGSVDRLTFNYIGGQWYLPVVVKDLQ